MASISSSSSSSSSAANSINLIPNSTSSNPLPSPSNGFSRLSFLNSSKSVSLKLLHSNPQFLVRSRPAFQVTNVLKTVESPNASVSKTRDLESTFSNYKPTILVSEKLGEAGLVLLRSFGNVDCSYDLSPEDLCSKISQCDALVVRSGTKVTRQVFEFDR